MSGPGYLIRSLADVPIGDDWLGERERAVQRALRAPARRRAWRLGRWAGKLAAATTLGLSLEEVEVLAAPDGAPEVWSGDEHLPVELSLSHRAGLALAVTGIPGAALGCDAELVEPRSHAFLNEWFAPEERDTLHQVAPGRAQDLGANAVWTAKESASKVRREGLRLDPRHARTSLAPSTGIRWAPVSVTWPDAPRAHGWWREHRDHVLCVMASEPLDPPQPLTDRLPV